MILTLCLLLATSPVELAEQDATTLFPADAPFARYFYLDNVNEKDRDSHLAAVSFILNAISTDRKIIKPMFVNKEKTVIRFDLRDYKIDPKNYAKFPTDPYTKKTDKLKLILKCGNPIMRSDWFITKAFAPPLYYNLLGVSDINGFRKRHGHDPETAKKLRVEQGALVTNSIVARTTRFIKRSETVTGVIWESQDKRNDDFLADIFGEKYDTLQVAAFNLNGLLSYFAADKKGNALEYMPVEVAADHTKSFEPDTVVYVARNCVACHVTGILPVDDSVRNLLKKDKNMKLMAAKEEDVNRLEDLFGGDISLSIKKDQDTYKTALMQATGLDPATFTEQFIAIHKVYNAVVTFEQAAKELGMTPDDFKKKCLDSGEAALVHLAVLGKIRRVYFEDVLKGK